MDLASQLRGQGPRGKPLAMCVVASGFCRAFGLGFRLGSFGLDCGFHGACRALGSVNEGLGFTYGLILGASSKVEPLGTLLGHMANTKEFRGLFKKTNG